jgi:hypothetical protein
MDGRKLQSAAEAEAAATGRTALALIQAGLTADRVAAELVRRSMDAAVKFKSGRPQPQQQAAGLKRKMTPAEKTQERKKRRQRQSQKKKEKKRVEEKERDEEERWNEMSWTFVEDAAMERAVAWRERRELLRAWRGVRECAREVERVEREAKVGWKTKEPTEEPTAESEKPVEHGGWGERLVWSDELEQKEKTISESSDDELGWEEVTAAIAMMQKSAAVVARNRATVEQNPLFTAVADQRTGVGPVVTSVEPTGAAGEEKAEPTKAVTGGTTNQKMMESRKVVTGGQIGDNRTDWRLTQLGGVSEMA